MQPLIFSGTGYAIAFWLVYIIWFVLEWIGSIGQRARRNATVQDRGSMTILILGLYIGLLLGFALAWLIPGATITWNQPLLFSIGIALMLLGIVLRSYAIKVLGRYFTRQVAIHPDQKVIQSGPYRFIRHPAYSGTLLTTLGVGLALTNWASLAAIMICTTLGYLYRVRVEEQALCKALGQPYIDYMKYTRRFIPFVF